jgi:carboxyl-terminal processing protease
MAMLCLSLSASCARPSRIPNVPVEDFVTGDEQAIADRFAQARPDIAPDAYPNALDEAFAAIRSSAYPAPEARVLAKGALDAVCVEAERLLGEPIPEEDRRRWESAACQGRGFAAALTEIIKRGPALLTEEGLVAAGVAGMASAPSPKVVWLLNPAQAEQLTELLAGREEGDEPGYLGLKIDRWPVVEVLPSGPAAEAGIRDGDLVVEVNGRTASAIAAPDRREALAGPVGEVARLSVKRGTELLSVDVRRTSFAAACVEIRPLADGILYVKVPSFEGSGVARRTRALLARTRLAPKSIVILDLRDNLGGRPEEANAVADLFLDKRPLQIFRFRDGRQVRFWSNPGAMPAQVILLTNRHMGSAAEMLAMALRDNDRATLIGESSGGMLSGKDVAVLANGQALLFLTEPTVLSPRGRDYNQTGIEPDIPVLDIRESGKDAILDRAVEWARGIRGESGRRERRRPWIAASPRSATAERDSSQ